MRGNRSLWVRLRCADDSVLWWVIFYLPPFRPGKSDEEWHEQVAELEVEVLIVSSGGQVLASGDANAQPPLAWSW